LLSIFSRGRSSEGQSRIPPAMVPPGKEYQMNYSFLSRVTTQYHSNHSPARQQAVPDKGREALLLYEAQQEGHADVAGHGRDNDPDQHGQTLTGRNAVLDQVRHLQKGGAGHDGERHQEGETGRALAGEAQHQPGGDGDARSGDAGNQRQTLETADRQGAAHVLLIQGEPLAPQLVYRTEDQAENDQK